MSIQRITPSNIENFTLYTYPTRTYSSSSSGVTGSVLLFARENRIIKDAFPSEDYGEAVFNAALLEESRLTAVRAAETSGSNISGDLDLYLRDVNSAALSQEYSKPLEVTRFTPTVKFTKYTGASSVSSRSCTVSCVIVSRYW